MLDARCTFFFLSNFNSLNGALRTTREKEIEDRSKRSFSKKELYFLTDR